jgi:UDP-N-acetylglucosamine acyltransferase
MSIHPTAIIDPAATLAGDVSIGAYAFVGPDVEIRSGCVLHHHASITGTTKLEEGVQVHPFASVGSTPQDLKYKTGELCECFIGSRTVIRESVTINAGSRQDVPTKIGSDCLLMAYAHVGHNSTVGNGVVIANAGTLGGHVVIGDNVIVGGLVGIHQFVRVGKLAIIGGCSKVVQDIPPFMMADGNPAKIRSINQVGLERNEFDKEAINRIKQCTTTLTRRGHALPNALAKIQDLADGCTEVQEVIEFVKTSKRGIPRGVR